MATDTGRGIVVELGAVTRALLAMVRDGTDEHALAARICTACVEGLDVHGAGMSLLTATDSRQMLWATDPVAELLEDLQFTLVEGACIEAATSGHAILIPDLRESTDAARWPVFTGAVLEQTPVRALFALPLQWGAMNIGVLDLYRTTPGGLTAPQWRDALAATDTAALMILGQRTDPGGGQEPGGWLDHAMGHRAEIHQATGMVLAQLGIGPTDALARMRGYAFAHERLLVDVARDVVARRLVFSDEMT